MEVCVDSITSALAAEKGGLCSKKVCLSQCFFLVCNYCLWVLTVSCQYCMLAKLANTQLLLQLLGTRGSGGGTIYKGSCFPLHWKKITPWDMSLYAYHWPPITQCWTSAHQLLILEEKITTLWLHCLLKGCAAIHAKCYLHLYIPSEMKHYGNNIEHIILKLKFLGKYC